MTLKARKGIMRNAQVQPGALVTARASSHSWGTQFVGPTGQRFDESGRSFMNINTCSLSPGECATVIATAVCKSEFGDRDCKEALLLVENAVGWFTMSDLCTVV